MQHYKAWENHLVERICNNFATESLQIQGLQNSFLILSASMEKLEGSEVGP